MKVFCGIDWASDHHDVALVDGDGKLLGRARIGDDAAGLQQLLDLLAEHGDNPGEQIPVAIETSRGLLVACLRSTGRPVYAVNPLAAARYRERHTVSRKKSDHLDAMVLANILRTDADAHRVLPADSELAQAVAVLARAQQDAVWDRTQAGNKLRSHLRKFFPGYLAAVQPVTGGLNAPLARTLLAAAPTPGQVTPRPHDVSRHELGNGSVMHVTPPSGCDGQKWSYVERIRNQTLTIEPAGPAFRDKWTQKRTTRPDGNGTLCVAVSSTAT